MGRRKKRQKTDDEQLRDWLNYLGKRSYIIDQLSRARGKVDCYDEEFTYYSVMVEGFSLMYRKRTQRTDGRKMYKLTDQLARLLGFDSYDSMRYLISSLQYWRGWVSPERLTEALYKYICSFKRFSY